jgi:peptide/nickel transport system substrate-binding protein
VEKMIKIPYISRLLIGLGAVCVMAFAAACGGGAQEDAVTKEELRSVVQEAVAAAAPTPAPAGPSAAEIRSLVSEAVAAAAPPGLSAAEISSLVEAAVGAATAGAVTGEDIERLAGKAVEQAVSEAVAAAAPPGLSAAEISSLVEAAVGAATAGAVTGEDIERLAGKAVEQAVSQMAPQPITSEAMPSGKYGGVLKVVAQASITSIDCMYACPAVAMGISQHIFEPMFAFDGDGIPQPVMVDRWSASDDGKVWTLRLRDGIKFHNGQPLTAEAVANSFMRAAPSAAGLSFLLDALESDGVSTPDDLTVEMKFRDPIGILPELFSFPWPPANVYPADIAKIPSSEDVGEENYIGSGPYELVLWERGNRLAVERFDGYVPRTVTSSGMAGRKHAYLDRIEWLQIPAEETKIAGLKTGEWDVVENAGLDFFNELDENPDIEIARYPLHQSVMPFNTTHPPTDNKLIRQAIQAAVDVDTFMSALGPKEIWFPCPAHYYCGTALESRVAEEFYNQNDAAKARQLMEQAGYDGTPIKILNPTDYATIRFSGEVMKRVLEDVGFNVEMPAMDWATVYSTASNTDEWNLYGSWGVFWAAPSPVADVTLSSTFPPMDWSNDEAKQLRIDYARAGDSQERTRIISRVQELLYDEVPFIRLGQWSAIHPYRSWVKNFTVPASPVYFDTWLEK